jgi:small-conductance mechanosensitive channel
MAWTAVDLLGYETRWPGWAVIPIFLLAWAGVTYAVGVFSARVVAWLAFRPGRPILLGCLRALQPPVVVLTALLGLNVALDSNAFPIRVQAYADKVLIAALAVTATAAAVRVVRELIDELAARHSGLTVMRAPVYTLSRAVLVLLGTLICLQGLGVPVSALLGAAGIAGLTVGLALQDTLRNFAGGIHLILDHPMRPGDAVTLEDGTSGVVLAIGWRSTRVARIDQSLVVIPNAKLAEQRIVNHTQLQKWVMGSVAVRLPKEASLPRAEALLRGELERAGVEIAELRREPAPWVSPAPGYSHLQLELTVHFAVAELRHQRAVADALLRRFYERLEAEGLAFAGRRP